MRILNFFDGYTSETEPTSSLSTITGAWSSPIPITAGVGISPAGHPDEVIFIKAASAVDITVNPQIAAGTSEGQRLRLIYAWATGSVLLEHGNGLIMNGAYLMQQGSSIDFIWSAGASAWLEAGRNDI